MIKNTKIKEKNIVQNVKSLVAIYIVYCHLENKKTKKFNIKDKDRTMLNFKSSIGLSLSVLDKDFNYKYKEKRAGPILILFKIDQLYIISYV